MSCRKSEAADALLPEAFLVRRRTLMASGRARIRLHEIGGLWGRRPAVTGSVVIVALTGAIGVYSSAANDVGTGWGVAAAVVLTIVPTAVALTLWLEEARLGDLNGRYVEGFEEAAIGMAVLSPQLEVRRANRALCSLLRRESDRIVGHSILEFTHPDDMSASTEKVGTAIAGDAEPLVKRYLRGDGTTVEAMVTIAFVEPGDSEPYFFSQLQDVTEQRRADRRSAAIADLGRRALEIDIEDILGEACQRVVDDLAVASCVVARSSGDEQRVIAAAGGHVDTAVAVPLAGTQVAYTLSEQRPVLSADLDTEGRFRVPAIAIEHGFAASASVPIPRSSGVRKVLLAHSTERGREFSHAEVGFLRAVAHIIGNALDLAARDEELRRRALEDPLTGLGNRAFLIERAERELRRYGLVPHKLGLLVLNLDRFSLVNDTLGHAAGDAVLRQVAARLSSCIRAGDIVARLGADEFAILHSHVGTNDASVELARTILRAIAPPIDIAGHQLSCSASIGIAVNSTGRDRALDLLTDAESAMHRAKEAGSGRYEVFANAIRDRLVDRLALERDLHHAIAEEQFELHYQPIVNLSTGGAVGFEALIRWRHPERGMIPPAAFIPVAEETDLIQPIGGWVVRTACAELATWPERYTMAINISAAQLHDDLILQVEAEIERHHLDPERLVLEVTESLVLEPSARPIVDRLRKRGLRVALDDFGTGYSSLGSLHQFPVDIVKIDRSLVDTCTDTSGSAVLAAVVELGEALGVDIVAEGVETPLQETELRRLGCELAQGYLYSRPVCAADAHEIIRLEQESYRNAA